MVNFKFELKKLFTAKRMLLSFASILIMILGIFIYNKNTQGPYGDKLFAYMDEVRFELNVFTTDYFNRLNPELTDEEITYHTGPLKDLQKEMRAFHRKKDYDYRYEIPKLMVNFYDAYINYYQERVVKQNDYLIYQLPEGDIDRVRSNHQYFKLLADQDLPYESLEYSTKGFLFTKSVFDFLLSPILFIILLFSIMDIFTMEKENGTEKFRLIQPVKRYNILVSKLFASLLYSLSLIIFMVVTSNMLAGFLGDGFNTLYLPLASGKFFEYIGMHVMAYIFVGILCFICFMTFVYSWIILLSTLFKKHVLTLFTSLSVLILGVLGLGKEIHPLNPFSYLEFQQWIGVERTDLIFMVLTSLFFTVLMVSVTHQLNRLACIQNFKIAFKDKTLEDHLHKYEKRGPKRNVVLRFEFLKIYKRKKIQIPILVMIVLVIAFAYVQSSLYEESIKSKVQMHESLASNYKIVLDEFEDNGLEADQRYVDAYEKNFQLALAYETRNPNEIVAAQKALLDDFIKSGGANASLETLYITRARLDLIEDKNLSPVLTKGFATDVTINSPFDEQSSSLRKRIDSRPLQPSVTYIYNELFSLGIILLILLAFVIFLMGGYREEFENKTLKFINLQPLREHQFYFSKFISQSLTFIGLSALIFLIFFMSLMVQNHPLEVDFPAVYYENSVDEDYEGPPLMRRNLIENKKLIKKDIEIPDEVMGFSFRKMVDENIEMTLMYLLIGFLIIALSLVLSPFIKSGAMMTLTIISLFSIGYFIALKLLKGHSIYTPFIWLNTKWVASGQGRMVLNNEFLNTTIGIVSLSFWTLFLLVIGLFIFRKRVRRSAS
jgi:ABC-type transport system involved in multi-copper enzyme maturation permease subunit